MPLCFSSKQRGRTEGCISSKSTESSWQNNCSNPDREQVGRRLVLGYIGGSNSIWNTSLIIFYTTTYIINGLKIISMIQRFFEDKESPRKGLRNITVTWITQKFNNSNIYMGNGLCSDSANFESLPSISDFPIRTRINYLVGEIYLTGTCSNCKNEKINSRWHLFGVQFVHHSGGGWFWPSGLSARVRRIGESQFRGFRYPE